MKQVLLLITTEKNKKGAGVKAFFLVSLFV